MFGVFGVDGLVLLFLLLVRIKDTLIEGVRVHFKLDHRFVPLTLSILGSLHSDGNLENNLLILNLFEMVEDDKPGHSGGRVQF